MTLLHNTVSSLIVLDSDGNEKAVEGHPVPGTTEITGKIALAGALGIEIEEDEGEIALRVDFSAGGDDPCFLSKYEAILSGGTHAGCYGEGPCDFNQRYPLDPDWRVGAPYWISTVNKTGPNDVGGLMLLGGPCGQTGLFGTSSSGAYRPSAVDNALELFDLCAACTDCEDYKKLYVFLQVLHEWLNWNRDVNLISPVDDYPLAALRLYKQYQALLHYWNYLVHSQSLIFIMQPSGSDLFIRVGYWATGCGPYEDVTINLVITQTDGQGRECNLLWPVELSRQSRPDNMSVIGQLLNSDQFTGSSSASLSSVSGSSSESLSSLSSSDGELPLQCRIRYVFREAIVRDNYFIADLVVWVNPNDVAGCAEEASENTFQGVCTWSNIALGTAIRTKTVTADIPSDENSSSSSSSG